jgi:curved DNA-binding protein CbpA
MYTVTEEMGPQQAYRVLGVSRDASAHAIKQAYRKLVKRWHPDLYKTGTNAHAEASQMARLINEAYSAVSHAPLRYQRSAESTAYRRAGWRAAAATTNPEKSSARPEPRMDRIEFWIRFVCGGMLGILIGWEWAVSRSLRSKDVSMTLWLAGTALFTVIFGFVSARFGDPFWHSMFRDRLD